MWNAERFFRSWLVLGPAFLASLLVAAAAPAGELEPALLEAMRQTAPDSPIKAILFMPDQVDLAALTAELDRSRATRDVRHRVVVEALMEKAAATQRGVIAHLAGLHAARRVVSFTPMWISNAIAVEARGTELEQLAGRLDVGTVYLDYPVEGIKPIEGAPPVAGDGGGGAAAGISLVENNLVVIGAPDVWAQGITGAGILVSSLDTGVDGDHPALASRWRANHPAYTGHPEWAWFDPVTSTTFPQDFQPANQGPGHGTHTMGIMCGLAPEAAIGVAPGAQWIHAAVIDRASQTVEALISRVLLALQWTVDPDGNPTTSFDVPWVSNNSWGLIHGAAGVPPCDPSFWSSLDAAEAAGVAVVFASGNYGPLLLVGRPADRAWDELNTFSVGAFVDDCDECQTNCPGCDVCEEFDVHCLSSGGIVDCTPDGSDAIKPEVVAPGVGVLSSVRGGGYQKLGGTSMACPHVAGTLALMFQANPYLTVAQAKQIVIDTAIDGGDVGNDIRYGWGRIDALNAVQAALALRPAGSIVVPTDYPTLQQAIAAAGDGDEILVLDGVYTGPGNRGLIVDKDLTIRGLNGAPACIIDCDDQDVGFLITGPSTEVVLQGLTIRNGSADTASGALADSGAGVRVDGLAAVAIRQCTIEDCLAFHNGAGIAFEGGSVLRVENCLVQNNTIPLPSSHGRGGGIYVSCDLGTCEVSVVNSLLLANTSDQEGGGVAVIHAGGGVSTPVELRNCTIVNNRVTGGIPSVLGGGVYFSESVMGNPGWGIRNCILWGNVVDDSPPSAFGDQLAFAAALGSTLISYCDVQGGSANVANLGAGQWGAGNIAFSPGFVNATSNFHLTKFSVCINAGDPVYVAYPGEIDLDGGARILQNRVEIGVDERFYGAQQSPPPP